MDTYDLLIIGSGPGGYKAALTGAFLGAKVGIIEKNLPGGNCLNEGCIPTKSLVHVAELLEDFAGMQGRGLYGEIKADFRAAMSHKDHVVEQIRAHFPVWLKRLGVHSIAGQAEFLSNDKIKVVADGEAITLQAKRIIIATGSRPKQHPVCETDGASIFSSQGFMYNLNTLPNRILCLGGGAIGTELGFVMHQFGSKVTIVEQDNRLLNRPGIPQRASSVLERRFQTIGVDIIKNCTVVETSKTDDGILVHYSDGNKNTFDKILVAIGREPVTSDLGLENTNVKIDSNGFIHVNRYLETDAAGIYAVGDVTNGPMTANAALHDAKTAASNAVKGNRLACNHHIVPTVIQSALQIATVGLSEDMAEEAGFEPEAARSNLIGSPKALARNETDGFTEITHDEETGQLLGGCIVGPEAGEQIQMLTAACQSDRGLWFFSDINYSHPSWCEELENAINPFTSQFNKSKDEVFQPGIYAAQANK